MQGENLRIFPDSSSTPTADTSVPERPVDTIETLRASSIKIDPSEVAYMGKPPKYQIVFLIINGPDMSAVNLTRLHAPQAVQNALNLATPPDEMLFYVMPGAMAATENPERYRVTPALSNALPIYIKVYSTTNEEHNPTGLVITGTILKVSKYLGRVTDNPIWNSLPQLAVGDEVIISYDVKRREGGLFPLPRMPIGSLSHIQRHHQDDKPRGIYLVTPDQRTSPYVVTCPSHIVAQPS